MPSTDPCASPKVPRPRTWCVHRRPGVLPPPNEPKDRPATRRVTLCTRIMEIAGMEGGETEENDRTGGKGNAGVGKVNLVRGNCNYHFWASREDSILFWLCIRSVIYSLKSVNSGDSSVAFNTPSPWTPAAIVVITNALNDYKSYIS